MIHNRSFSSLLVVPGLALLGACSAGNSTDDVSRVLCDVEVVSESDSADSGTLGFSAADVVDLINGTTGGLTWSRPVDGFDSTDALTLDFAIPDSTAGSAVQTTVRTPVNFYQYGSCLGIDGDALQFSVNADYSNADGSLHATGIVDVIAGSATDPGLVLVGESRDMVADLVPDDIAALAETKALDSGLSEWEVTVNIIDGMGTEGSLASPVVDIGVQDLAPQHFSGGLGRATLTPD